MRKTAGIFIIFRGFSIEKSLKAAARWDIKNRILRCNGYISQALRKNNALTKLELGSTAIDDKAIVELSLALKEKSEFITLNLILNNNEISDVGVKSLSQALRKRGAFIFLEIDNNQISDNDQISDVGEKTLNPILVLVSLDLSYNPISNDTKKEINLLNQSLEDEINNLKNKLFFNFKEKKFDKAKKNLMEIKKFSCDLMKFLCNMRDEKNNNFLDVFNKYLFPLIYPPP